RREVFGCHAVVIGRRVAEIPDPHEHPDETATSEGDERPAPRDERDQPRHDRRGDGVAEARERMRDALRKTALMGGHPTLHRARRDWERRAFADAEHEPAQEQGRYAAGEAGEYRRGGPDETADEQRDARSEPIPNPPAEHLKEQVRKRKGREDEPELRIRQ